MSRRNRTRNAFLLLIPMAALLTVSATLPGLAFDDDNDPRIVPIDRLVEGRSYEEWTAAWWQWATAFAPDVNPVLDQTGAFATSGQSGKVFFLAGNFGGTAVRNVTISRNVNIFAPIANSEWDTVPGFTNPLNLPDPLSVSDCRRITSYFVSSDELTFEIDGVRVRNPSRYRVKSPVFSLNFDPDFATFGGYPAPYVRTAVSDGYWLMLEPLNVGHHVIHFTVSNRQTQFALDVTYNLTVTH